MNTDTKNDLEIQITDVGRRLASSFKTLLLEVSDEPHRPQELARMLGTKKDLSSRVLMAIKKKDPMAVTHLMPGPDALRRLLTAAEKHDVPQDVLAEADIVVAEFEDLIRRVAGDRGGLDSIVSAWLPDAREKVEMVGRQAVYRGMSTIKGCATDILLSAIMLHPSDDGSHVDAARIEGAVGLRRMRPGAVVKFDSRDINKPTNMPLCTLDGEQVMDLTNTMLDAFCSSPMAAFEARRIGETTHYVLAGDAVGLGSAVDVHHADVARCCGSRYQKLGPRRKRGPFASIDIPSGELIFDALLHEDVYPGSFPSPVIYDTTIDGLADANDPARDVDRMNLATTIQHLGSGSSVLRIGEIPNYVEMIQHVFDKMGWDASRFRAYRLRMKYPVYGSQIHMLFDAPDRPAGV